MSVIYLGGYILLAFFAVSCDSHFLLISVLVACSRLTPLFMNDPSTSAITKQSLLHSDKTLDTRACMNWRERKQQRSLFPLPCPCVYVSVVFLRFCWISCLKSSVLLFTRVSSKNQTADNRNITLFPSSVVDSCFYLEEASPPRR